MSSENRFLLHNATVVTGDTVKNGSVAIFGKKISNVWYPDEDGRVLLNGRDELFCRLPETFRTLFPEATIYDLTGKLLFAGGIDTHVHFREPGLTEKADIASESLAAAAGGVTSFVDMPNTTPPTVSAERLAEKIKLADGRSFANFGFHIGATNSNFDEISSIMQNAETSESFGGIKVFMGSSTGNMLVDSDSTLEKIFKMHDKTVLVHCEDEAIIRENIEKARDRFGEDIPFREHENIRSRKACIKSSAKALEMAIRHNTRLHLLHISTEEEVEMVKAAKKLNPYISAETSANYLWFSDMDYDKMGSRLKCNPSVKTPQDRSSLRKALLDGTIDTIGSDHAPHRAEEKERKYLTAPSGLPSIQQSLPVLLTVANEEGIPLTRIASVFSEKAADLFGIRQRGKIKEGFFADLTVVDPEKEFEPEKNDLMYKCGWSPYEGVRLKGKVETVFVSGTLTIDGSRPVQGCRPSGEKIFFEK